MRLRGRQCSEPHNLSDQRPSYRLGTFCPCAESSGLGPTLGPGVSAPKVGLSLTYPWSHHWPAGGLGTEEAGALGRNQSFIRELLSAGV